MENVLKFTKPMMHGAAVKRVQELLGLNEVDGVFGRKTEKAVKAFQKKYGLAVDGIVGQTTWRWLKGSAVEAVPGEIVDIRHLHKRPKNYHRERKWSEICGVTLHQTGCDMPNDPLRWAALNAHYGVLRNGIIVWCNDETDFIWHAQGLSKITVGIEFEGNFPGVIGDMSTLWRGGGPPCSLTREQHIASHILRDHIKLQFMRNSCEFSRIFAHRQSSDTRTADPGEDIWKKVALSWAKNIGLTDADGGMYFKMKQGKPIPVDWDSRRKARYR